MNAGYARDLDLNLFRVLLAVADTGSVTKAASTLYLTQPAVSAALKRLAVATGTTLFARQGRGLVLTERGETLVAELRPHLAALLQAAMAPPRFDPRTSERTLRLGLSDATESWLLPRLLGVLAAEAPSMRVVVVPVQFRTVEEALVSRRVDVAVSVADELPASVRRRPLFHGGFVCLFDPRHVRIGKLTRARYFAQRHVVVSYNGDLRGLVEDVLGENRNVRCSVASFEAVGAVVDGGDLLATVPDLVARSICAMRPHLRVMALPFALPSTPVELLWPVSTDTDAACSFLREKVLALVPSRRHARADALVE